RDHRVPENRQRQRQMSRKGADVLRGRVSRALIPTPNVRAGHFMEARKLGAAAESPFQLSLRIRHPSMDPAEISRELHLESVHSFRAGEPRESSSKVATASVHAESYWLASLDTRSWTSMSEFSLLSGGKRLGRASDFIEGYATSDFNMVLARWMLHLRMH